MKPKSFDRQPKAEDKATELWKAVILAFAERVWDESTEDERMSLDRTGGDSGFSEDALRFALSDVQRFKPVLAELIAHLATVSKNVLFDPVHLGGLYLDRYGEVVVTQGDRVEMDLSEGGGIAIVPDKILMLTGPQRGQTKTEGDIDIVYPRSVSVGVIEE